MATTPYPFGSPVKLNLTAASHSPGIPVVHASTQRLRSCSSCLGLQETTPVLVSHSLSRGVHSYLCQGSYRILLCSRSRRACNLSPGRLTKKFSGKLRCEVTTSQTTVFSLRSIFSIQLSVRSVENPTRHRLFMANLFPNCGPVLPCHIVGDYRVPTVLHCTIESLQTP